VQARYFLDRVALGCILVLFPATSALVLRHRPISARLGHYHWIAYAIINALLLLEAWRLINWGGQSKFYVDHEWRRKLVAALGLPASLLVGGAIFPLLIEGTSSPGAVVIFF
jgi:uncharacterized membrane protein